MANEELQNYVKIMFRATTSRMLYAVKYNLLSHFFTKIIKKSKCLLNCGEKTPFSTYEKQAIL